MKRMFSMLVATLLLAACTPAVPPVPTSEEAINHEAEQLIRISLTDRLMVDSKDFYNYKAESLLKEMGRTPDETQAMIEDVLPPLLESEHQRLVDFVVPIYRRYYTAAEIHQLLAFYQTEVARKSMQASPQIAGELQIFWQEWGEHFGALLLEQLEAKMSGKTVK